MPQLTIRSDPKCSSCTPLQNASLTVQNAPHRSLVSLHSDPHCPKSNQNAIQTHQNASNRPQVTLHSDSTRSKALQNAIQTLQNAPNRLRLTPHSDPNCPKLPPNAIQTHQNAPNRSQLKLHSDQECPKVTGQPSIPRTICAPISCPKTDRAGHSCGTVTRYSAFSGCLIILSFPIKPFTLKYGF